MSVETSPITARDARGRTASPYRSSAALIVLIADVARAADGTYPGEVSMRRWNDARAVGGHPQAPSAESIHQRLNRRSALKLSWQRIVDAAFAERPSQTQIVSSWRTEKNKELDERHVRYAMGLVAAQFDGQAFPPEDYERVCEQLIVRERRRVGDASVLEGILPVAAQVERIAGSWEAALSLVGLAAYEQRAQRVFRHRNTMSVVEAAALFVTLNERFPSYPVMSSWAREANLSLSMRRRASGGWWTTVLDDVTALLQERGLQVPPARPKAGRPAKGTDRSYILPAEPIDAAAPGDMYWNAERIVVVLRVWEADIPAGIEPTLSRYRGDQRNHPDWPAPETIRDHGPWETLRDEAARRNTAVARRSPTTSRRSRPASTAARKHDAAHARCTFSTSPVTASAPTERACKSPTSSPPGCSRPASS